MGTLRRQFNEIKENKIRQEALEEIVQNREKQLEERAAAKAAKAASVLATEKEATKPKAVKEVQKFSKPKIVEPTTKEEE